jgi:hypothetical protein
VIERNAPTGVEATGVLSCGLCRERIDFLVHVFCITKPLPAARPAAGFSRGFVTSHFARGSRISPTCGAARHG